MKWGKTLESQLVPFDEKGNQETYSTTWEDDLTPEQLADGLDLGWGRKEYWRPNEVFADTLEYVTYHRGRSSALLEFRRLSTRTSVFMFMTDMDKVIPLMTGGKLGGMFTFCKRGQNYGIKLVSEVKTGNL